LKNKNQLDEHNYTSRDLFLSLFKIVNETPR